MALNQHWSNRTNYGEKYHSVLQDHQDHLADVNVMLHLHHEWNYIKQRRKCSNFRREELLMSFHYVAFWGVSEE